MEARRGLIAVGCDRYDHLRPLLAAESDARRVFSILVDGANASYEAAHSGLLLSPTVQAFKNELRARLYDAQLDMFALYFAGHAAVVDQTLFLAFKDTDSAAIPLTGFSMLEDDPFLVFRARCATLGALLPSVYSPSAADVLQTLLSEAEHALCEAIQQLVHRLTSDDFALLARGYALSELFFLPIRISDVLGIIGVAALVDVGIPDHTLRECVRRILDRYGESVIALSDEQAGPLLTFFLGALRRGWIDEAEEIVGRLFNNLVQTGARVCRDDLSGADCLKALFRQYELLDPDTEQLFQSPSDLLAVVLGIAAVCGLDEAIDEQLVLLDHSSGNIFLAADIRQWADERISDGANWTFSIGREVCSLIEMRRWIRTIADEQGSFSEGNRDRTLVALIAVVLRDRPPWQLLFDDLKTQKISMVPLKMTVEGV